jgi:hypothetical protein
MKFRVLVPFLLASCSLGSFAQSDSSCIVAGRLSEGAWAPRLAGVQLIDASGRSVTSADKSVLSSVKQVRLASPALLSRCDGDAQLALGGEEVLKKQPAPAAAAGTFAVEAVSYPKLRRGGELVELKVTVPAERVTMLTR